MDQHNKDQAARELANAHYAVDPGIRVIYRLMAPDNKESAPQEPIKLLEVNSNSAPLGIQPVFFGPDDNIPFPSVIVDIAPVEFDDICTGKQSLPNGWSISVEYAKPVVKAES